MKKRIMLVAIATAFALMFNLQLAFAEEADTKAEVTRSIEGFAGGKLQFGEFKTMIFRQDVPVEVESELVKPTIMPGSETEVTKNKEVIVVMDSSKVVIPPGEKGGDPFDYVLFSGSENESDYLLLTGNVLEINGSAHSNSNIELRLGGTNLKVSGGTLNHYGNDLKVNDASASWPTKKVDEIIKMPDLSNHFKTANAIRFSTEAMSTIYAGKELYYDHLKPGTDRFLDIYGEELGCTYNKEDNAWQISGNTMYLDEKTPYFFEGNVSFNIDKMVGNGVIVATGSIYLKLGNAAESEIGMYSINGGICIDMANGSVFTGLLYAPGEPKEGEKRFENIIPGTIDIKSDSFYFYGSIVGRNLSLSGNKTITYKETKVHDDFQEPDKENVSLDETKERVIEIIKSLGGYKKSNVKFATIIYSDHAEIINSDFSTINSIGEEDSNAEIRNELIEKIKEISDRDGSNLGDGLRLAYNLFEKGEEEAEKYLIVFSNNPLNMYTVNSGTDNFRTDGLQLTETEIEKDVKTNSEKAYEYAEKIAGMMKDKGYKGIYFVDVRMSNTDVDKLSKIGQMAGAKKVGELYCYNPEPNDEGGFLENLNKVVTEINAEIAKPDTDIIKEPDFEVLVPISKYEVEVEFGINEGGELKYLNKLPDGVKFIGSDDLEFDESTGKLSFKEGFKLEPDIVKGEDTVKLYARIPDLKVNIRFMKTGTCEFELAKLVYVFKGDGSEIARVPVDIKELSVDVISIIDIN